MTPERGKVIASKYRLERPLAAGGMGTVWVARHQDLDVDVAIKFMSPELLDDDVVRHRFKREARAAAQLKGPNITQIHDYGAHDGAPYIAMELLEGEDLQAVIERADRPGLAWVCAVVVQLCRGLTLAHDAGIVHRDLKPSNVFLSRSGDLQLVKVLDFGVAKLTSPGLNVEHGTASGTLVGSPRYMSPEQATGERVDHRSDLWSLAVLIYELLTGVNPFDAHSLGKIITLICVDEIDSPRQHVNQLPEDIDAFFARAFARRREDRFSSAAELADAFVELSRSAEPADDNDPLAATMRASASLSEAEALIGRHEATQPGIGADVVQPPSSVQAGEARGRRDATEADAGLDAIQLPRATATGATTRLLVVVLVLALAALAAWGLRDAAATFEETEPTPGTFAP